MAFMRWFCFSVLTLFLSFAYVMPSTAVLGDGMYTACDVHVPASELLLGTTETIDFSAGCDTYRQCSAEWGYLEPSCHHRAALTLLETCDLSQYDEITCRQAAFLYAELIHIFTWCSELCDRSQESQVQALHDLSAGLTAYDAGDYTDALMYFPRQSYTMNEGILAFARAIIYWSAGDVERSLEEISIALQFLYGDPIVLLVQAELQAALGHAEYAGLLAEQARCLLSEEDFQPLYASLTTAYPFSETIWEAWTWYPVRAYSFSPGGEYNIDLSREPAQTIHIGFSNDQQHMIAEGLLAEEDGCGTAYICLPFIVMSGGDGIYSLVMAPDRGDGEQAVFVSRVGDAYNGEVRTGGFEWRAFTYFMIAPPSAPDPRTALPGEWCGVRSRLEIGMTEVRRVYIGGEQMFPIFNQPGGREFTQVNSDTTLQILGERVCQNDITWWFVSDGQVTGWIAENDGTRYLFHP